MDPSALEAFDREPYLSLATKRRDGRMVRTPVWFAASGGRLYVFSEAKAGKVKRLRNFPELEVAACDVRGKVHGPFVPGRGRRVEDSATLLAANAALARKYGWKMAVANFFSRLTGRIDKRAMLEIEL